MQFLWPVFRPVWPALAFGLLVLAALFHAEAAAAVHVWATSTAYGHCVLVLPLALWLIWDRRYEAAARQPKPLIQAALLGLPLAAAWLGADLLGIMEGRQLAAIGFVEVLLLSVLGVRLWWALAAGFLYLLFLVPFGAFVTPYLQNFTAGFVAHGLRFLSIPGRVTAFQIQIPEGSFYVAEACAGLRFLIASVAFGVLYAVTMFRSPWRRAGFIVVAVLTPIVANGFRALGIVVLGHILGSAQAAATDHILYGWIFFTIVILLLACAGMPFRQDPPLGPSPIPPLTGISRPAMLAALPVTILAVAGPAVSFWLNRAAPAPEAGPVLITPPGCAMESVTPEGPVLTEHFVCGASHLVARFELLPHRANPSVVMDAGMGQAVELLGGGDIDGGQLTVEGTNPQYWAMQRDRDKPRAAAATLFIDGSPALGGIHDRLHLMRDLLTGTGAAPAALAVAVTEGTGNPEEALQRFLGAQGDLNARVARQTPPKPGGS
jgi:exosortase A